MSDTPSPRRPKETFWTIPNGLSILRVVLAVPFMVIMLMPVPHARWWGFGLLVLAVLTDRYDGILARRWGQVTEWGRILDPLADKVGAGLVALTLVLVGDLPVWFLAGLLVRDLLILAGGLFLKARIGEVLPSNQAGKWTIGVVAATFGLALAGVPAGVTVGLVASTIMLCVSLALYVKRFGEVMKDRNAAHGIS